MSSQGEKKKRNGSVSGRRKKVRKSSSWRESKEAIKHDLEKFLQDRFNRGDRMERKREKIMTEIFASERRYLEQLDIVINYFMRPMRKLGIVPENDVRIMFGDLTAIQAINKELLAHMEEMSVGEAFLQLAPYLKLYCTYANNFEKAIDLLQEWENKTSHFAQFLKEQERREECRSLTLHALLITPIQRVPRYKLLLKQLLDHTTPSHPDYQKIKDALHKILQVTRGINEYIREHENFQKILDIQKSLGGGAPKLIVPGRRFIKEGPLMKVSKRGNGSHERMFFLFSDILIYAKHNTSLERPLLARPYTCSAVIQLQDCSVNLVLGDHKVEGAGALFKLSYNDDHLLLYSIDQNDALSWIDQLQGTIQTLKRNRASLRTPSVLMKQMAEDGFTRDAGRTPFRSSMRLRNLRRKQLTTENASLDESDRDSLYPMRTKLMGNDKKVVSSNPSRRKPSTKDSRPPPSSTTRQGRTRRQTLGQYVPPQPAPPSRRLRSRRPSSLPPKLSKKKNRRLERGPMPLKKQQKLEPAQENEETLYEDALSHETMETDDNDSLLYRTALHQHHEEIYPLTPSREGHTTYRRGDEVFTEMPALTAEHNGNSSCTIL